MNPQSITTILTIGIPTLTVLVGILLDRRNFARLNARLTTEMKGLREK
jgi:hypothetical protein